MILTRNRLIESIISFRSDFIPLKKGEVPMDDEKACDEAIEFCGIVVSADPMVLRKLHMTGEHCKDPELEDLPRHKDPND